MRRLAPTLVAALVAAAAPAAAGDEVAVLAAGCTGCHVSGGGDAIPPLEGRDAEELRKLLLDYRNDASEGTVMNRLAKGYAEEELIALADYFAALGE